MVVQPDVDIRSRRFGGTGVDIRSRRFGGTGVDSAGSLHTRDFPYRLEAGTINLAGIIGLCDGLAHRPFDFTPRVADRRKRPNP